MKRLDEKFYSLRGNQQTRERTILIWPLTDYSDNEYQGFAVVHYNINNTQRDISAYPEQADVSTNTGLQTSGNYEMDHFAGDLMKGTKTSGYAAYPLKELSDVNAIKTLRINFSASYKTDDYNDENSDHTYDFTLTLN